MTACSLGRPFGVRNYAPSDHMVSTKDASSILGIGSVIINTILLLDFIAFYLRYSGRFNCIYLLRNSFLSFYRLRNFYGILYKIF